MSDLKFGCQATTNRLAVTEWQIGLARGEDAETVQINQNKISEQFDFA